MTSTFIYGSCVTRDAFDPEIPHLPMKYYVARQSIISAMLSQGTIAIDVGVLDSAFQRRMVQGDIEGDLTARIQEHCAPGDIIVWDITDERFGVLCFDSGPIVTPTQELRATSDPILKEARHVAFGTPEHLALFRAAVGAFADWLQVNGLAQSVLALDTPHSATFGLAARSGLGDPTPALDEGNGAELSRRADAWNQQSKAYYEAIAEAGIFVSHLDPRIAVIDPEHKWGIAPFHFSRSTYDSMLEEIEAFVEHHTDFRRQDYLAIPTVDRAEYGNKLAGIWPNGLEVDRSEGHWRVTFPNHKCVEFRASNLPIDWEMSFETDSATSILWLRSLIYLPIIEERGGSTFVNNAVKSFEVFLRRAILQPEFFRTNSLDHAIALALSSLCRLRVQRIADGDESALRDAEAWLPLVRLLERLVRNPKLYAANNHGMFVNVAILNSRWIWPGDDWREGTLTEDIQRMRHLLDSSFSPEGVTVENTPHYQAIWILLTSQALYIVKNLDLDDPRTYLSALLPRITDAYSVMLLPNGDIPPFGDGMRAASPGFESAPGELFSESVGLFIDSRVEGYLAFKCGFSSSVHKHLDDNAIYIEVAGVELVSDAGLLNYDSFDEMANLARGQLGHSSIAFRALDYVPQSFLYPASGELGGSCSLAREVESASYVLRGKASFLNAYHTERTIRYKSLRNIVIEDRAWSSFGGEPVQRFLVPDDAALIVRSNIVEVARHGVKLAIEFVGGNPSDVSVRPSVVGDFYSIECLRESTKEESFSVNLSVTILEADEVG